MKILWTATEVIVATGGTTSSGALRDWCASGVSIDTRTLQPGDLFIPLEGGTVDGHHFVSHAFEKGAVAALGHNLDLIPENLRPRMLWVPDTFEALRDLARYARQRTSACVGAVTGSFGKTSCKEALKWILSKQNSTHASARSFNNHIGVPLSLAQLAPKDHFGIFEIGTNHPGEIGPLGELVQPQVALITNVEEMHRQNFQGIEEIAREKARVFDGMSAGDLAILNRDNSMYDLLAGIAKSRKLEIWSYGHEKNCDLRLRSAEFKEGITHFQADFLGRPLLYHMPVFGTHWGLNSLGVLGMVQGLGGDVAQAAYDLGTFSLPAGRGDLRQIPVKGGTLTLIDETYNAGPLSMKAAIHALARIQPGPQGRRIAALGDMLELGEGAEQIHRDLHKDLTESGIDQVYTSGPLMRSLFEVLPSHMQGAHQDDPRALGHFLASTLRAGDVLMAKGSHGRHHPQGRMYDVIEVIEAYE